MFHHSAQFASEDMKYSGHRNAYGSVCMCWDATAYLQLVRQRAHNNCLGTATLCVFIELLTLPMNFDGAHLSLKHHAATAAGVRLLLYRYVRDYATERAYQHAFRWNPKPCLGQYTEETNCIQSHPCGGCVAVNVPMIAPLEEQQEEAICRVTANCNSDQAQCIAAVESDPVQCMYFFRSSLLPIVD